MVSHSVNEFTKALWEAVAIVMAVSLLSLGLRAGTVVALSIPLVLAVVFITMNIVDIGLQRVSLGALIISLGLLVDDAMITVESMVTKLEEGWDKANAAIYAYDNTHFPMGTGTLVTIFGFIPVGLAQSTAGEYTFSCLRSCYRSRRILVRRRNFLSSDRHVPAEGQPPAQPLTPPRGTYIRAFRPHSDRRDARALAHCRRRSHLARLSAVGMTYVPQQFFPASDRVELVVDLKLPQNSSIHATQIATAEFDRVIAARMRISRDWSTYVGRGAVHFYLPMHVELANDFFAQSVIVTKSLAARERVRKRLETHSPAKFSVESWRACTRWNWARRLDGRFSIASAGPTRTASAKLRTTWPMSWRRAGA